MSAYWLTFKPKGPSAPKGWDIEKLRDLVARFEGDPSGTTEWWRIANLSARVGERVYLFKQGDDPRGIFGVGTIIGSPKPRVDDSDGVARLRAQVRFERLVDPTKRFLLRLEDIRDVVTDTIINAARSGIKVPETAIPQLEVRLTARAVPFSPTIGGDQADDPSFDPDSVTDERQRSLRAIRIRRGQPAFRTALLDAYSKKCVITDCGVEDVLEAAHITPYLGQRTNHVSNGLLLRADIHTLFDCGLVAIHPDRRTVVIAKALEGSSYAAIAGTTLRAPRNVKDGPSRRNLQKRFSEFEACERRAP
jgi:putative restriction endonuclease